MGVLFADVSCGVSSGGSCSCRPDVTALSGGQRAAKWANWPVLTTTEFRRRVYCKHWPAAVSLYGQWSADCQQSRVDDAFCRIQEQYITPLRRSFTTRSVASGCRVGLWDGIWKGALRPIPRMNGRDNVTESFRNLTLKSARFSSCKVYAVVDMETNGASNPVISLPWIRHCSYYHTRSISCTRRFEELNDKLFGDTFTSASTIVHTMANFQRIFYYHNKNFWEGAAPPFQTS